jgi:hypothetical protein
MCFWFGLEIQGLVIKNLFLKILNGFFNFYKRRCYFKWGIKGQIRQKLFNI